MRSLLIAPENEVPIAVPVSLELGRASDAAVLLTSLTAYSTGMEVAVSLRVRPSARRRSVPLHQLISGFGLDDLDGTGAFLLGVQYSDGRRAMTAGRHAMQAPNRGLAQRELFLTLGSSTGTDCTYDLRLWLSPLPPAGPVTLVCRWPDYDISDTTSTLDGAAIASAGRAAVELWPEEFVDEQAPTPRNPPIPDSGWFAGQD